MIKPTKATIIIKKELDSGLVKRVIYKEFIEYWVYKNKTVGVIDSSTGVFAPVVNTEKLPETTTLKCVIVCEDKPDHIKADKPEHIVIAGAVFNDVDYPDLTDYLCKTERPPL